MFGSSARGDYECKIGGLRDMLQSIERLELLLWTNLCAHTKYIGKGIAICSLAATNQFPVRWQTQKFDLLIHDA